MLVWLSAKMFTVVNRMFLASKYNNKIAPTNLMVHLRIVESYEEALRDRSQR